MINNPDFNKDSETADIRDVIELIRIEKLVIRTKGNESQLLLHPLLAPNAFFESFVSSFFTSSKGIIFY